MHPNLFLEAIRLWARGYARRFAKLANDPKAVQERTLLKKIVRNRNSDFGRKHRFDTIKTIQDFRSAVPVTDYEYVRPYVDACIAGRTDALFGPGTRIRMFALTSGTHAKPKHIPVTDEFLEEYRVGWRVWGAHVHQDHPTAFRRGIMQLTSSWQEKHTELGVPCGSISGLNARMQPRIINRRYLPGLIIHEVDDPIAKYYLTSRLTLARRVSIICTANPSSVLAILKCIERNAEMLIRDIRDGTISKDVDVPDAVRKKLRRRCRPDRSGAKRIEDILSRTGRLRPVDYWPDLAAVSNWKGGTVHLYLRDYPDYFGSLPVRDIGLLATEGRMTIPLSSDGSGGVLDVGSHFFEFIPADQLDQPNPETLLAEELEPGQTYGIVITTSCGLYRYNIGDVIRMDGFWQKTPVVTFLSKGRHVSNLTGEKLTEHQVVEALTRISSESKGFPNHVLISPEWGDPPRYSVTVESDSAEKKEWGSLLEQLDRQLSELNVEYRSRRTSGRLAAPTVKLVPTGSFERMKKEHIEKVGGRREQYKHVYLSPDVDFHSPTSG